MKYYSMASIKSPIMKRLKTKLDKQVLSALTSVAFMYKNIELKDIYLSVGKEISNVFNEDQIEKINLFLTMKDKMFTISSDDMQKAEVAVDELYVHRYTDFNDLEKSKIEASKNEIYQLAKQQKKQEKYDKNIKQQIYGTLTDYSLLSKPMLALDFEFKHSQQDKYHFSNILEVGLSIVKNSLIETHHYIIEENKDFKQSESSRERQHSFAFGQSQYVSYHDLHTLLNVYFSATTALIVHDYSAEIAFLDRQGIGYEHLNIFDTQMLYRYNFKGNNDSDSKKLCHLLQDHRIVYKDLHNAGNDSQATAELFQSMCKKIIKNWPHALKIYDPVQILTKMNNAI